MTFPRRRLVAVAVVVAVTLVASGCGATRPPPGAAAGVAGTAMPDPPETTAPPPAPSVVASTTTAVPETTSVPGTRPVHVPVVTAAPTTTVRAAISVRAAVSVPAPATPPCPSNLAGRLASTAKAEQLVTVDSPAAATTVVTVTLWQRRGGCWVVAAGPWPGRIGGAGFSDHHREGDDSTPTGAYGIGPVIYGNAANPGTRYPYHRLTCGDWWDEDPASAGYNTFQHVACGAVPPFGAGSEALWQETAAYPSFAVVDYNTSPVVAGAGSGIFVHADIGVPTAGCVSVPLTDLDVLLRWLEPAADPLVIMGPDAEIARF